MLVEKSTPWPLILLIAISIILFVIVISVAVDTLSQRIALSILILLFSIAGSLCVYRLYSTGDISLSWVISLFFIVILIILTIFLI